MAYRRRRTNKRYGRRRRTYRRTFRRRNYSKPNKVYYFKRNFQFDNISIDHVNFFTIGYAFTLAKVPNYVEFQNLFDMYQIRAVKLTFRPEQSQSISLNDTANAQIYNRFFSAIDYNSDAGAANPDILRQYSTLKVTGLNKIHSRYLKPKTVDANGANPGVRPWLPTTSSQIPYYGLRIHIERNGSTGSFTMIYSVECTLYMAFKNVL